MSLYYEDDLITLHHGDALNVAHVLEPGSVQTIVTSPPYFGLRDYGDEAQMGAERSVGEYVARLADTLRVLRDALADDGTLWLNLGDSYSSDGGMSGVGVKARVGNTLKQHDSRTRPVSELPAKNMLGVPWRVAFALQDDGWILRSDIIWQKSNPMPESVTDRPTKSHEHLFLFAKSQSYYYDGDAIAEDSVRGDAGSRFDVGKTAAHQLDRAQAGPRRSWRDREYDQSMLPSGMQQSGKKGRPIGSVDPGSGTRNKRDVWTVATTPFPGSHFAVYPPELIRPCILAGSRRGDTVLDPFSGSGTTGMVATQEGRRYIGIDLNRDYLDLSLRERFQNRVLDMTGGRAS